MRGESDTALKSAALFTALALGFASLFWGLVVLAQRGVLPFAMAAQFDLSLEHFSLAGIALFCVLNMFGPAIAALLTVSYLQGRPGLIHLWRSVSRWRAPGWLYALAFIAPLAASAIIVVAGYALGLLRFAPDQVRPLRFVLFFFVMIVVDGPLGEEIGWRGVLLPQLLKRMDPLSASFIVGCIWFLWHMPLYLAAGKPIHPVGFFINVVGISFIFTWFYLKSGYSTFMAIFLHTTTNYALFLVIRSFGHPDDIEWLQIVYDVIIVVVASFAARSMWKRHGLVVA